MLCGGCVLLYALYVFVDLALILQAGRYGIGPDEYIWAAIVIYLDVVQLFLYILRCLALFSRN